jgi:ArsR family transcriptional regulator, arsenate/arsenite/antimonite-responsive transcriptional repressor
MGEPTAAPGRSFLLGAFVRRHASTMVGSTSVDASVLEAQVTLLKALADPTRLRVIALLRAGPRCVCDLQGGIDVPANLLSHHLKVLREAGVIDGSRRGRWIDYRLRPDALAAVERLLTDLRAGHAGGEAACRPRGHPSAGGARATGATNAAAAVGG